MQIGVVFPQTEIGAAVADVRRYGETVEELGFAHLLAYDHVLGADPEAHAPWRGPYDVHTTFHEPFVLFGYLAACTRTGARHRRDHPPPAPDRARRQASRRGRPARPTGASGWASASAGTRSSTRRSAKPFGDRGRRMSEQIALLRRLLTEPVGHPRRRVRPHHGRRPRPAAGAAPDPDLDRRPVAAGLPARRPARRRLVPAGAAGAEAGRGRGHRRRGRRRGGTGPGDAGHGGPRRAGPTPGSSKLVDHVGRWRDAGATHVSINTMNAGLGPVDRHLEVLAEVAAALPLDRP